METIEYSRGGGGGCREGRSGFRNTTLLSPNLISFVYFFKLLPFIYRENKTSESTARPNSMANSCIGL